MSDRFKEDQTTAKIEQLEKQVFEINVRISKAEADIETTTDTEIKKILIQERMILSNSVLQLHDPRINYMARTCERFLSSEGKIVIKINNLNCIFEDLHFFYLSRRQQQRFPSFFCGQKPKSAKKDSKTSKICRVRTT